MSKTDSEETLKCDKEGYFDLDSLKPYSSVWVSTCRRDIRTKRDYTESDREIKKIVTPSRACNNLHSLLETMEGAVHGILSDNGLKSFPEQLSSTKSEFLLNPIKFDKGDSGVLKNIPNKLIESICRPDKKFVNNDSALNMLDSKGHEDMDVVSIGNRREKRNDSNQEVVKEKQCRESSEDGEELCDASSSTTSLNLMQQTNDSAEAITNHKSTYMDDIDKSKRFKLLSEHGKLVSEFDITTMNLKDQTGREFPIRVKYVWETDMSELANAASNVLNTSNAFIKMLESVSSVGLKSSSASALSTEKDRRNNASVVDLTNNKNKPEATDDKRRKDVSFSTKDKCQNNDNAERKPYKPEIKFSYKRRLNTILNSNSRQNMKKQDNFTNNTIEQSSSSMCMQNRTNKTSNTTSQRAVQYKYQTDKYSFKKKGPSAQTNDDTSFNGTLARPSTTASNRTFGKKDTNEIRPPTAPTKNEQQCNNRSPGETPINHSASGMRSYGHKFQNHYSNKNMKKN